MTLDTTTVSGLDDAATPLTGTERVPMDQGGTTVDATTAAIAGLANPAIANAVAAHVAAADPHPGYTTPQEASAAAPVQSVNTRTGAITLSKNDVSLSNVDNTSDANKPVSTAQAAALANKADLVNGLVPSAQLPGFVTDQVAEGSVNLYFTAARARNAISVAGSLSYNPVTGVISFTFDPASPGALGATTAAPGTFTRLTLPAQGSAPSTPSTGFTLYANASNALSWRGANGFVRVLDGTANTADRIYVLPDASGTVALAETTLPRTIEIVNLAYSATINIDFAAYNGRCVVVDTLTGPVTFTFSNISQGRFCTADLVCDSTARALTFPAATPFIGPKPSTIAASKVASLTFECRRSGTTDASVRIAYGVQA